MRDRHCVKRIRIIYEQEGSLIQTACVRKNIRKKIAEHRAGRIKILRLETFKSGKLDTVHEIGRQWREAA